MRKIFIEYRCAVTFVIVVLNLLVFALMFAETGQMAFDVNYMYEKGAMVVEYWADGQYYRLVSAMFLHFDFEHLGSNMLMLAVIGSVLEAALGHLNFGLIYAVGGIIGNVFSGFMHRIMNESVVAAGASGAVFAMAGALVYMYLTEPKVRKGTSSVQIAGFVILLLYQCVGDRGVDNYAHFGGLVTGFVLAMIMVTIKKHYNIRKDEMNYEER